MESSSAVKKRNKQQHAQNLKNIMLSKIIQIDKSIYSVIQFTLDPNIGKLKTVLWLSKLCSGSGKYRNSGLENRILTG